MALFRKRLSFAEAVEKLLTVVGGANDLLKRLAHDNAHLVRVIVPVEVDWLVAEFVALRLFGVLVATKNTRYQDWESRGRELFDSVEERVVASTAVLRDQSKVLAQSWLYDRLEIYGVSANMGSSQPIGREIGKSFSMMMSDPDAPTDALSGLGWSIFDQAVAQVFAIQSEYKLA